MDNSDSLELYQQLEEHIRKIIDCEVWGLDLIAEYAMVTKTIKLIRNKHPFFAELEAEYKEERAKRKSKYIKQKMAEYVE